MKATTVKTEVSVPSHLKRYMLLLTLLNEVYGSEREKMIRDVARYYAVTL